ncbi:MAG: hypothetical protein IMW91_04185 [Firmicutes bacterium]|nr:hypothetical protein [Bacillota bacterium]
MDLDLFILSEMSLPYETHQRYGNRLVVLEIDAASTERTLAAALHDFVCR